jgi:hypothetical protein
MTAGQKYYMEQVHHNGAAGGTHATATFKGYFDADPANGTQTAFRTNWIGTYVPQIPWVAFLQQPTNVTQLSGGNPVTFTVAGQYPPSSLFVGTSDNPITFIYGTNDQTHLMYQWYKNGVAIPGATKASYTQPTVLPSDAHAQFVCAMRAYGYADSSQNRIYSNSAPAVLTVVTDTVPPTIVSAVTFVNTNWPSPLIVVDVTFSKWMNTATLSSTANYSVPGATVTNVVVASNNRTVELDLNQMPTLPVVVTVHSGKDLSGNSLAANSTQNIVTDNLNFSDVGTPGTDPAYPSYIWIEGNGGYLVSAEGSDIFNAHDGFNFGWEQKTGDFDVVTRGVSNGHTSNFAKMGLMVRETLDPASRNWNVINDPTPNDGVSAPDGSGSGANNVECNYRTNYGSASISWKNSGNNAPTYPNAWVRIKRTGTVLTGFSSTNGVNWAQLAIYDTATNTAGALASTVLVGICTTAHNNDPIASLAPPPPPYLYYNTAEYAGYNSSFVAAPPILSISVSGGNVNISWTPSGGTLYASPAIDSTANWQPVGTANPATVPVGAGAQFFKVIR